MILCLILLIVYLLRLQIIIILEKTTKTTTFYIVLGLTKPDKGRVLLNDEDITHLPMYVRAKKGISYLPQEPSIFRKLTVKENILAILETLDISGGEREMRLEELLGELHIAHLAKAKAYTLSGGERRRVEIARALVTNPSFMLLDEPFSGIDPIAVSDIQTIITKLRTRDLGLLITDHNVRETLSITDRSYIMAEGKILVAGRPDELASNAVAREAYLGESFSLH